MYDGRTYLLRRLTNTKMSPPALHGEVTLMYFFLQVGYVESYYAVVRLEDCNLTFIGLYTVPTCIQGCQPPGQ